jgi:hypothetical protein
MFMSEQDSSLVKNQECEAPAAMGAKPGNLSLFQVIKRHTVGVSNRTYGMHRCPGIFQFLSTFEADPVGPPLDGENATQAAVTASKRRLQNPAQRFHKSRARLRSQELLASSQSSRERTLARASAIEQSAAP